MTSFSPNKSHPASSEADPVGFLNPTSQYLPTLSTRRLRSSGCPKLNGGLGEDDSGSRPENVVSTPGLYHLWRSRDNRKGRHAIVVSPNGATNVTHPGHTNTVRETARGLRRMLFRYPIWDISYDVAVLFTIGSAIWVVNGLFVLLPSVKPSRAFPGESGLGGGITAFVGATIFEVGSILLMLEAINEKRTDCFGWAVEEALESRSLLLRPDPNGCAHHHQVKKAPFTSREPPEKGGSWKWWPTWYELKTHFFRQIGFLACFSQLIGATIFWIAGFTGLPPILNNISLPATNGIYWLPQVVGAVGFIISSWLFMLETQSKWFLPAPKVLGWHIGFWNLVGAFGFAICGALGFASGNERAEYGSLLSTFIGSLAFLIGSAIQWYESLDKYPITVDKSIE